MVLLLLLLLLVVVLMLLLLLLVVVVVLMWLQLLWQVIDVALDVVAGCGQDVGILQMLSQINTYMDKLKKNA